jgi:hypothetical protein
MLWIYPSPSRLIWHILTLGMTTGLAVLPFPPCCINILHLNRTNQSFNPLESYCRVCHPSWQCGLNSDHVAPIVNQAPDQQNHPPYLRSIPATVYLRWFL